MLIDSNLGWVRYVSLYHVPNAIFSLEKKIDVKMLICLYFKRCGAESFNSEKNSIFIM